MGSMHFTKTVKYIVFYISLIKSIDFHSMFIFIFDNFLYPVVNLWLQLTDEWVLFDIFIYFN